MCHGMYDLEIWGAFVPVEMRLLGHGKMGYAPNRILIHTPILRFYPTIKMGLSLACIIINKTYCNDISPPYISM